MLLLNFVYLRLLLLLNAVYLHSTAAELCISMTAAATAAAAAECYISKIAAEFIIYQLAAADFRQLS